MSYQQPYRPSGFNILPPVVKNLLIINAILYLAYEVFKRRYNIDLDDLLGLHFPTSPKYHWYQFFTYMFMHAGLEHIFFNMFGLWTFGYVLENFWGPQRFLFYYIVTGLGAAFVQIIYTYYQLNIIDAALATLDPDSYLKLMDHYFSGRDGIQNVYSALKENPHRLDALNVVRMDLTGLRSAIRDISTVGASGALFGILLAFGMLFPNTELMMLFFPIPIKAKYFVILYGAIELFSGVYQIEGDFVAHFAHLGGMLFGFILIKIWQKDRSQFY
jgi:membrane associated rhomboid family serine protease